MVAGTSEACAKEYDELEGAENSRHTRTTGMSVFDQEDFAIVALPAGPLEVEV